MSFISSDRTYTSAFVLPRADVGWKSLTH